MYVLHVGTCCYVESTQRNDVSHQVIKHVNHRRQLLHGYVLRKVTKTTPATVSVKNKKKLTGSKRIQTKRINSNLRH